MAKKFKLTVTRKEFSDFYILSALSHVIEREHRADLLEYRNRLINDITSYYIPNVHNALIVEACHHGERRYPTHDERKKVELEKRLGWSEEKYKELFISGAYDRMSDHIKALSNQGLIDVFRYCDWSPAFGGEAWASIADLYAELVGWRNTLNKNYSWNSHGLIRDHMSGEYDTKLRSMMTVIDRLHQAEHNTGSIFTKFGDMTAWLHLALNEKAIRNSIQVLKTYASPVIAKAAQALDTEILPDDEIERQLGETIISRASVKYFKKCYYNMNSSIENKKYQLDSNKITKEIFEQKKEKYIKEYDNAVSQGASPNIISEAVRDLYYAKAYREARGVIRCLLKDENHKMVQECFHSITDLFMRDRATMDLCLTNEKLMDSLAKHVTINLGYMNGSSLKNALDFCFDHYDTVIKNLKNIEIKKIYVKLCEYKYDVSKFPKPAGLIDAPKPVVTYDSMAKKHPTIAVTDVKAFATQYAGKKIKATYAYAGEIAAFNGGDKWAYDTYLGKIIGYDDDKVLYTPSTIMKSKGYAGCSMDTLPFGAVITLLPDLYGKPKMYYKAAFTNIELQYPPALPIAAPYGLKKDGTPKKKPGKKSFTEKAELKKAILPQVNKDPYIPNMSVNEVIVEKIDEVYKKIEETFGKSFGFGTKVVYIPKVDQKFDAPSLKQEKINGQLEVKHISFLDDDYGGHMYDYGYGDPAGYCYEKKHFFKSKLMEELASANHPADKIMISGNDEKEKK